MTPTIKKSGANLHLSLIGETYDGMYCGVTESIGSAQVPLTDQTVACFQVLVQASNDNDATVFIGNQTHGCVIELVAGATVVIPINDVEKVYARVGEGEDTQQVNWIAMI